jgi:hypothetical protein
MSSVKLRGEYDEEESLSMKNQVESELYLSKYLGHYIYSAYLILGDMFILWLVAYPALYHRNLFWPFIVLYEQKNFFALIGLLGFIGLFVCATAQFFTIPFKINFSEEGIRAYSLSNLKSYLIKWEDLTEFKVIKLVRTRYQVKSEYTQIVIVSDQYSTKTLGSLGPSFGLKDLRHNNAANIEQILELCKRKYPQLVDAEILHNA